jgi:hypothetical protein
LKQSLSCHFVQEISIFQFSLKNLQTQQLLEFPYFRLNNNKEIANQILISVSKKEIETSILCIFDQINCFYNPSHLRSIQNLLIYHNTLIQQYLINNFSSILNNPSLSLSSINQSQFQIYGLFGLSVSKILND